MKKTSFVLSTVLTAALFSSSAVAASPAESISTYHSDKDELAISFAGRYDSGAELDSGGSEIVEYDKKHQRAFSINGDANALDILDLSDTEKRGEISLFKRVKFADLALGDFSVDGPTSVAVHPDNDFIAVAIVNDTKTENGEVVFLNTDGELIASYQVGALPDMLTFTSDGSKLLVANEAEPNDDYTKDPEGSVSIIDISSGPANGKVATAGFKNLDNSKVDDNVRTFGPEATAAQDFEPEYITVSDDNKKAYVSLQENNAIAELDLMNGEFTAVHGLGFKDHSLERNALDASNDTNSINMKPMPVLGMYQPDAIASYTVDGKTYIITPNEGDSRDYDGYSEETRVGDLEEDTGKDVHLNADFYEGFNQDELDKMVENGLFDDDQLGRLHVTTANGLNEDDEYEALYSFGGRSFSIYQADQFQQVYDSGDEFENIIADARPEYFNTNNDDNGFKSRSDDKGPEPESAEVGKINGKTYAFIGLERQGGIMVYNIDNPEKPYFVNYFSTRDFSSEDEAIKGDSAPEGLTFIAAEDSPTDKPMLLAGYEVSGTVAAYNVESLLGEKRLAGKNRYETAVEISKEGWEQADTVVIARGDIFADALAGTPLAYKEDAPILLSHNEYLDDSIREEVSRLQAKHAIILGGPNAVSSHVQYQLSGLGLSVERIYGDTRFGTAANVAARLDGQPEKAIVVNGDRFADALAAAPYAAKHGYPILLSKENKIPEKTELGLTNIDSSIVIGGEGVVGPKVMSMLPDAKRYAGTNRFETAAKVVNELYESGNTAFVSTGYEFADALTGSVLAAKKNAAALLVKQNQIPDSIAKAYNDLSIEKLYILGGPGAVNEEVAEQLKPEW
ncbi:choice-of-anchor I family protein [Halobacillus salinarum]|uniref:Choice-of-anchor I family protein n=1 Tax=Halobacillus salinarum TaxID=2932257 RepID=A0ABY4EHM4_9BACI|nr:choice-of-anchor I family protein [Halobacillus salinarum]UOQ43927.1 choice-of-anchor I family protein [Halobacillus salinarum]